MTWVKRGGGSGQGVYGDGLAAAVEARRPVAAGTSVPPQKPRDAPSGVSPGSAEPEVPSAYRPQCWQDVLMCRTLLEVLARYVTDGGQAQMSMLYEDALEAFGPESRHLSGACQGQAGAAAHYQRTVAGGRYAGHSS